ncbi:uncharacterized protein [Venturia canescens]|uniref:uncharacterized protein n=1 Tax=Venturia canescens TaxID=32260 RepID=UPI001C9CBCB6|nr:uncharacterized protein LOC122417077 [Venturia canescens]
MKDSLPEIKKAVIRFYNLYFHGTIETEDNLIAVVADAVAMARIEGENFWNDEMFVGELFYVRNSSSLVELPLKGVSTYSKNLSTFKATVNRIVQRWKTNDPVSSEVNHLLQLTGFLALTMWRASIKNKAQMHIAFKEARYTENLMAVAKWPAEKGFAPPCESYLDKIVIGLAKGLPETGQIFLLFIRQMIILQSLVATDSQRLKYLSISVMTDTASNGLGILSLLQAIQTGLGMDWKEVKNVRSKAPSCPGRNLLSLQMILHLKTTHSWQAC